MTGDPLTDAIILLATHLGVPPVTAAVLIPLAIIVCNRVARVIPDNATGVLNYVRIACKVIGMHVKDNSGVPAVIDTQGEVIRRSAPAETPEPIEGITDPSKTPPVTDMFGLGAKALQAKESDHAG